MHFVMRKNIEKLLVHLKLRTNYKQGHPRQIFGAHRCLCNKLRITPHKQAKPLMMYAASMQFWALGCWTYNKGGIQAPCYNHLLELQIRCLGNFKLNIGIRVAKLNRKQWECSF